MRIPILKDELNNKFTQHMKKVHSATCSVDKLAEICIDVEEKEKSKGVNLDNLILEEKQKQQNLKKRKEETVKHSRMFLWNRNKPRKLEEESPSILCFICKGAWAGRNKKDLEKHLENDHEVLFKVKKLVKLSRNKTPKVTSPGDKDGTNEVNGMEEIASRKKSNLQKNQENSNVKKISEVNKTGNKMDVSLEEDQNIIYLGYF